MRWRFVQQNASFGEQGGEEHQEAIDRQAAEQRIHGEVQQGRRACPSITPTRATRGKEGKRRVKGEERGGISRDGEEHGEAEEEGRGVKESRLVSACVGHDMIMCLKTKTPITTHTHHHNPQSWNKLDQRCGSALLCRVGCVLGIVLPLHTCRGSGTIHGWEGIYEGEGQGYARERGRRQRKQPSQQRFHRNALHTLQVNTYRDTHTQHIHTHVHQEMHAFIHIMPASTNQSCVRCTVTYVVETIVTITTTTNSVGVCTCTNT
jgi:hypothetical protein